MAERARSKVNLMLDGVLARLRGIGDGDGWLSQPKTVQRRRGSGDLELPRPALLVKLESWGPNTPGISTQNQVPVTLKIAVLVRDAAGPDETIHNVVADVISALANGDETFGKTVVGGLFVESYEADTDLKDGGQGEAIGIVTVKGLVHWEATAP